VHPVRLTRLQNVDEFFMKMAQHLGGNRQTVHQSFILHYWSDNYHNAVGNCSGDKYLCSYYLYKFVKIEERSTVK
jgi:hypothetical protein